METKKKYGEHYILKNENYEDREVYNQKATEEHSMPLQTSGINQSSPTAQPTLQSVCQSENDMPVLTKHVEQTTLQNTSITVSEPVFTIQLDMHIPEVRDSPYSEILKNLHDF